MSDIHENDFPPLEPQPFVTEEGREIERLRRELDAAKAELSKKVRELAAMQKQRDEARRVACYSMVAHANTTITGEFKAEQFATMRGWDCFKEGGGA